MKVLITGYRGFIGTHLTRELRESGYRVYGHGLEDGDLSEPDVFLGRLKRTRPDHVIHLAAQVGRLFNEDDHDRAIRGNVVMTSNVARACAAVGVPLMYASTSEVYGDHGSRWCYEDSPLTGKPSGMYALSKRWGEDICNLYAPQDLRIIRPTMPYGRGCPPGRGRRALDNFLWLAYHDKPIPVHEGAERSWCAVEDVVRGVRMVLEGPAGTYNVGRDDDQRPMSEVASMAIALTGSGSIEMIKAPALQTVVKRLNTWKLRSLGWSPTVNLEDGMRDLLEWIKQFPYVEES